MKNRKVEGRKMKSRKMEGREESKVGEWKEVENENETNGRKENEK